MRKIFPVLLLFLSSIAHCQSDSMNYTFPSSVGFVSDFDNVFSSEQEAALVKMISDFEKKTTNEIAVVTVTDYGPYKSISDYTLDLFNTWGVGKAEQNNGLIILLCLPKRSVRITTGLGTEKILTDSICQKILDEDMLPELKKGNHYKAVKKGLKKIMQQWKSD